MRIAPIVELDSATDRELRVLCKRRRVEVRHRQRAQSILLAELGWQNKDIAQEVDLDRRQVAFWRSRSLEGGIEALRHDAPRSGTLHDRVDAIAAARNIDVRKVDRFQLERFLSSRPYIVEKYFLYR